MAMRAIQTDQFVEQDLVQCLMLLAVRDPSAFAKFLALTLPKRSYLAARPHAEVVEPRDRVSTAARPFRNGGLPSTRRLGHTRRSPLTRR